MSQINSIITNVLLVLIHLAYLNGKLIWSDEFNGDTLDETKWNYYTDKSYNHELEKYTAREENVFLENGNLVLQALEENFEGYNYTSGRVDTNGKGNFLNCTVKVRAKLSAGRGLWPAIWMLPTYNKHGPGVASGELDIMEFVGNEPNRVHSTVHYGYNRTDKDNLAILTFRFSDVPSKYTYPFDDGFYLVLNLAVGGNWPGPPDDSTKFPKRIEIDYVRIYDHELL